MGVSLSHLVFAVNQVLFAEKGKSVFEGKEGKGVIQKAEIEMEWNSIHLCSDPFTCDNLINMIVNSIMETSDTQIHQDMIVRVHLKELEFHFYHSLITVTNIIWNHQSITLDSATLTTNKEQILSIQSLQCEKNQLSISLIVIHYSPLSIDATFQSICTLLLLIPKRWRLALDWHLLANSRNWISGPRLTTLHHPPFRTHLTSHSHPWMLDFKQCLFYIAIDSNQSSMGSRRPSQTSAPSSPTTLLLQTHLVVALSSQYDPSWSVKFLNSRLYESDQLLLLVSRGSLIGHDFHYLDIAFSHIRVNVTPSQLATVIHMAQEITFSVWCALFDIWATLRTGCFQSARLFNAFSTDHSARQGTLHPPNSRRNRDYSDPKEYERIRDFFWSTGSTDGNQLDRMECLDTEVVLQSGSWSLLVNVNRWGSNYMPAIDFFFEGIRIEMNGICVQMNRFTFQEVLISDCLLNGCEGELKRSKSVFGILTLEYLLRSEHCNHPIDCKQSI